mgnify:FL=1
METKQYIPTEGTAYALFACGCFWGTQYQFARQQGVLRTFPGYIGGHVEHPSYEEVKAQRTGHLEGVVVEYDPRRTSFRSLCQFFFEIHDPAQLDGQGPDIGSQYLSAIFCRDAEQRAVAEEVIADLRSRGYEVNTQLRDESPFWIAEEYHQDYYAKTGGEPYCHLWVKKF